MANVKIYILWLIVFFFASCCVIACFFVFPFGNYCGSYVCNQVAKYMIAFFGILFLLAVFFLIFYYVSQRELYQESKKHEKQDKGAKHSG